MMVWLIKLQFPQYFAAESLLAALMEILHSVSAIGPSKALITVATLISSGVLAKT